MPYLLSPGVLANEKDYTLTVPAVSSTTAATVIASEWGRCEEIVSLFSEADLINKFYKPTIHPTDYKQSTYLDFFTISNFFGYGNNVKAVRLVGDNARNANAILDEDGTISSVSDLIIKNQKGFDSRRNSGLLAQTLFAAKYPSELGNSIAISICDKYSFPHWIFKTAFSYAPEEGEFNMVVLDTGGKWVTDAYLAILEKFEGLSFIPGDRKYDGSSKYYKTAINQGSKYVWVGEQDFENNFGGETLVHNVLIENYELNLTASSVIANATRKLFYTPTGGTESQLSSATWSLANEVVSVIPSAIAASGNARFEQKISVSTSYTPVPGIDIDFDITSTVDFKSTDTISVSYLADNASTAITLTENTHFTVDDIDNTVTILADLYYIPGTITITVTRNQTIAVTANNYVVYFKTPDVTHTLTDELISGSNQFLYFTPTGGSESIVNTSLYTLTTSTKKLTIGAEAVPEDGNMRFSQLKNFASTVTPSTGNPVIVDTTASIDLTVGDTIVVTFKPTGQSQVTLTPTTEYTIDEALNTITVLADVLASGIEGVLTVRVTRDETFAVIAPDVVTNEVILSSYQNIDIVYERTAYGIRRELKSYEFTRSNINNTVTIDAGIITTAVSGDNTITFKFSKDPNPVQDDNNQYTAANTDNIYSFIKLASGVSDNNIGELDDNNSATVVNGFNMFRNANTVDVSLILAGQYVNPVIVNWVISNVAEIRQDCVYFFSPPLDTVLDNPNLELDSVLAYANAVNYDTTYAHMDSGWKYQYDRFNDTFHWIPLNPDCAGIYARTAYTNDPWWSGAGFNRGKVSNVVKLAWNPGADFGAVAMSGTGISGERDELYQRGINPVVNFSGEGVILFGDKTFTVKPTAFSRMNVRFLFNYLKKAISKTSKYFLFEFNDETTREIYKMTMAPFLRDVEARRGIQKNGWAIICDSQINTAEVIDRNEFKALFLIKPSRVTNFIYLSFAAVRTDSSLSFSELEGL